MNLSVTRRRKGLVCATVTRLEDRVTTLEAKETLKNTDHVTIQQMLKRLETLDGKFKTHHFAVVDLVKEQTLDEEQAVLDDHNNKVLLLTERLQLLAGNIEAASPSKPFIEPSQLLSRRLCHLENSLRSINLTVEPLAPGPDLDNCLVPQLEEQVGHLWAEFSDITHGILSLEQEGQNLFDQELTHNKALFDLSLWTERLLNDQSAPPPTNGLHVKVASNCLTLMSPPSTAMY